MNPSSKPTLDPRPARLLTDLPESAGNTERPLPRERVVFETIAWTISGSLTGTIDRGEYRFVSLVQQLLTRWQVIGLVTPLRVFDVEGAELEGLFAEHAHQVIGNYPDFEVARREAQKFLETAPAPSQPCTCEAILP